MNRTARAAAIVLASGTSRRFGGPNKLLAPLGGRAVVRRTVEAYVEAKLCPVLVVVGYEEEKVGCALHGLDVELVSNPEYPLGQSQALRRGVRALPDWVPAVVIGVGDQPLLRAEVLQSLLATYRATGAAVVVPRYAGQRGNPVLFDRSMFAELLAVEGDIGGRQVIERHRADVAWVDVADPTSGRDIDTPEDLRGIEELRSS